MEQARLIDDMAKINAGHWMRSTNSSAEAELCDDVALNKTTVARWRQGHSAGREADAVADDGVHSKPLLYSASDEELHLYHAS